MVDDPIFTKPSDPVGLDKPLHEAGSLHISANNGFDPSKKGVETAFAKVFPGVDIAGFKSKVGPFFNDKSMVESGAYNMMVTAMRIKVVPVEQWQNKFECKAECLQGSRCYGPLKYFAMTGDMVSLKAKLQECGGGAWLSKLTDADLMWIFGPNEHRNFHTHFNFGYENGAFFHGGHCSSLNYLGDKEGQDDCPVCTLGWHGGNGNDTNKGEILGGMNDTGNAYQWGWFEAALKAKSLFPSLGLSA